MMTRSLIEHIKKFEGYSSTPYKDSAGLRTIGYGHLAEKGRHNGNGRKVTNIDDHLIEEVTAYEAEAILIEDLKDTVRAVNYAVEDLDLSQNKVDALISLVYNIGIGAFKSSTLLKRLKEGKYDEAAKEFLRWNKATINGRKVAVKGLTNRRIAEKKLFEGR